MNLRAASNLKGKKTNLEKKLTAVDIAESIKRGLAQVKLIEEGKIKAKSWEQFLEELRLQDLK
jgi:hypothetical protein